MVVLSSAGKVPATSERQPAMNEHHRRLDQAPVLAGPNINGEQLGDVLRKLRGSRGWTLAEVSRRTGLSVSTLSKVENNKNSLTYNNLARLAEGLNLDLAELLNPRASGVVAGHWTRSMRGTGRVHETDNYMHEYLCADLVRRRMVPMLSLIKARTLAEFGPLISHPGEEFFFVTEGTIDVYLEASEPVRLRAGDSFYFDSSVGHALISVGAGDAYTLTVISPFDSSAPGKQDIRPSHPEMGAR